MLSRRLRFQFVPAALVLASLLLDGPAGTAGRLPRVAVAGGFPSGFNGLLAREGLPRAILLDYQLSNSYLLQQYDLVLVTQLSWGALPTALPGLLEYVRNGGTALLDSNAMPPPGEVPGTRGGLKRPAPIVIVGGDNPLNAFLPTTRRFPPMPFSQYLEPESTSGLRVLARYEGNVDSQGNLTPVSGEGGTPAIWQRPLGHGQLVYCGPGLGFALSLNSAQVEPLAIALLRHLTRGAAEPQLIPEGIHLGGRQSAASLKITDPATPPVDRPGEGVRQARPVPALPATALPKGFQPIDADHESPEYNLTGTYSPAKGAAAVLLNSWNPRYTVAITFSPGTVELGGVRAGKPLRKVALPLPGGAEIPFVIKERWDTLSLFAGGKGAQMPVKGLWRGKIASRGAALSNLSFQPVEPVYFSDDFMRTSAQSDTWERLSGQWTLAPVQNPDMGANPFTFTARAEGTGWAVTGYAFWDDYVLQTAVKATSGSGTVGLGVYFQDAANHVRFQAAVQEAGTRVEGGFALVRQQGDRSQVLAQCAGCLVRNQWYLLSVRVRGDRILVSVDGRQVLAARDTCFPGGKVGLLVQSAAAKFDDVQVQPASSEPFTEGGLDTATPKFAGAIDVDSWAAPPTQWEAQASTPGLFWRRGRFHGDLRFLFRLPAPGAQEPAGTSPAANASGRRLTLLLAGDGNSADSGYAFTVRPEEGAAAAQPPGAAGTSSGSARPQETLYHAALLRQGAVVARGDVLAAAEPLVTCQRVGQRLLGWIDRHLVVEYEDAAPVRVGECLGFRAEGFRPRISSLKLHARQVLDYTFDQAPTDWWVSAGTWEVTNRWACTPDWSWFGGMSPEVAAIWNKHGFAGDLLLDMYVGPRMMGTPGRTTEICRAFNAVLCGDGRSATSGYSFEVGVSPEGVGARLLRNGVPVTSDEAFRLVPAHNRWFNVRAARQGTVVSLWVEGQRVFSWEDPQPLPGGYTGIWTRDNGIIIPRVTLFYERLSGQLLSAF